MKNINTPKYWDNFFKEERFQKRHCWRTGPYKIIANHFDFTKVKDKTITDLGCAFGDGLQYIYKIAPNNKYIGIDYSKECIKQAKKKYSNMEFKVQDINDFNTKCDILIIAETLEHLDNDNQIINKLMKLANTVIITVPYEEEASRGKLIDVHLRSYTETDFADAKLCKIESNYLIVIYNK